MAKQFGFDQRLWYCRTIEINESCVAPWTLIVDSPGDKFFARSCRSGYQHRRVGRRDTLDDRDELLHCRRLTD